MKTIEIKLYKFDELSDKAKEYAINKWIELENQNTDLLHFFSDYCAEQAEQKGFTNARVQYSLGYCQGDGLSFSSGFDIETLAKMFEEHTTKTRAKLIAENCNVVINGNDGHYFPIFRSSTNCREPVRFSRSQPAGNTIFAGQLAAADESVFRPGGLPLPVTSFYIPFLGIVNFRC